MRKLVSLLLMASLVMTLVFAGCGGSDANTIKVGVNYELTGDVSSYGQSSVEGIELAVKEINEAGGINGKKIKLVKIDNKSEKAEAVSIAERLMTRDKVVAVLGPATSGAFGSTIPAAMQHKVPVASGSTTADNLMIDENGNVKDYAFRICFSDSYQGSVMAAYAVEKLGKTKAIIIMDNSSDYARGLADSFERVIGEKGGTIVAREAYAENETDFSAIVTKIKGMNFDVIFVPGYYEEAGLLIKQLREQGIDVPVLGADGFDSPVLLDLAGAAALNEVYFSNHYSSIDDSPVVQNFIASFKEEYGKEPDAFAALGYDLAKFVADGIKRAMDGLGEGKKLTGENVKDALEATTEFTGVTGSFSIDENHDTLKAIVVISLEDGVQVSSERISAE